MIYIWYTMHKKRVIGLRVSDALYELVREVSDLRGEETSQFIRRAVRKELASLSYLSDDAKKALGVETREFNPS